MNIKILDKNKQITAITILLFSLWIAGCENKENLSLTGGKSFIYRCENNIKISARYYSLSDRTLDFVKITLPDNKEYTLPRLLSASGVRYSDEGEILWWTKGNSAFCEKRDENGKWKILYIGCNEQ